MWGLVERKAVAQHTRELSETCPVRSGEMGTGGQLLDVVRCTLNHPWWDRPLQEIIGNGKVSRVM